MCGIVGVFSNRPIDMYYLEQMNEKIFHRGPDGYGYLSSQNNLNLKKLEHIDSIDLVEDIHLAFGHRRLAIHDLSSAGQQPMSYLNRYWIVFNGEIYNFIELKVELEVKGYVFHSHTDTEVIMAAYDCWGAECLNKFNGDWAFVLIDIKNHKIFIARDRFGVKPLYYFVKPGFFAFASEIKALLEHPQITRAPNIDYLKAYLDSGPKEYFKETAFQDIYRFDFGHYFEGDLNDLMILEKFKLSRYWSCEPNPSNEALDPKKLKGYVDQYYLLLEDAVKLRLRSDVKVGAALSGGLDSSSIVYLINELQRKSNKGIQQETFSSVYKTPGTTDCDESEFIEQVSKQLGVHSNQIEPKVENVPTEHAKMIYHMENPPETTLMSSWHTFKLVGQAKIKVNLDGQGADEQLAGYLTYLMYFFAQMPLKDIVKEYCSLKDIPLAKRYIKVGVVANCLSRIIGKRATQFLYQSLGRRECLFLTLNKKLLQDFVSSLVTLLHYADSTAMAYSVESRMPFMDYRLVEYLASVPVGYKLYGGWTKFVARAAFVNKLPDDIVWRRDKIGWGIPEGTWFSKELRPWMEKTISESPLLKHMLRHVGLKKLTVKKKIRLLNLAVWYNVFFEG